MWVSHVFQLSYFTLATSRLLKTPPTMTTGQKCVREFTNSPVRGKIKTILTLWKKTEVALKDYFALKEKLWNEEWRHMTSPLQRQQPLWLSGMLHRCRWRKAITFFCSRHYPLKKVVTELWAFTQQTWLWKDTTLISQTGGKHGQYWIMKVNRPWLWQSFESLCPDFSNDFGNADYCDTARWPTFRA